ncbi:MAG: type II secretion system protein [Burkholderiales bacterium]
MTERRLVRFSPRVKLSMTMSKQTGFTYIWLLLIVALIGLGLSVAAEVDSITTQREKEKELLAIGRQFRNAIEKYHDSLLVAGKREYPSSLEDMLQDNRVPGIRRHLRKIFVDPITGKSEWGLIKLNERIVGVHSLSEKKPIKQNLFDPDEESFQGRQKYSDWLFTFPPGLLLEPAKK